MRNRAYDADGSPAPAGASDFLTIENSGEADIDLGPNVRATRYVIVSPVRDEAATIRRTLNSVIAQTIQPREWVIVDDGSSDDTAEIVAEYSLKFPWIRLLRRDNRGKREPGAGVVEAFYEGFRCLRCQNYDFLVKLDGDLSFGPVYFENLFRWFAKDPKLGMASGNTYLLDNGQLRIERASAHHVRGPLKCYRRQCFEDIGGLVPHLGWDSIDEVRAQRCGWKTRNFRELVILHYRRMGSAEGIWRGKFKTGQGDYFMGSHPIFELLRCIYRMTDRPYVLGGLAILSGYLSSWLKKAKRIDDPGFVHFLRRQQMARLKSFFREK